jgi:hypothetical protein
MLPQNISPPQGKGKVYLVVANAFSRQWWMYKLLLTQTACGIRVFFVINRMGIVLMPSVFKLMSRA